MICRTKPEKEKKEYVIPLIKQNKWRREDILKKEKDRDQPLKGKDAEEDEALKEILEGTLFWLLWFWTIQIDMISLAASFHLK